MRKKLQEQNEQESDCLHFGDQKTKISKVNFNLGKKSFEIDTHNNVCGLMKSKTEELGYTSEEKMGKVLSGKVQFSQNSKTVVCNMESSSTADNNLDKHSPIDVSCILDDGSDSKEPELKLKEQTFQHKRINTKIKADINDIKEEELKSPPTKINPDTKADCDETLDKPLRKSSTCGKVCLRRKTKGTKPYTKRKTGRNSGTKCLDFSFLEDDNSDLYSQVKKRSRRAHSLPNSFSKRNIIVPYSQIMFSQEELGNNVQSNFASELNFNNESKVFEMPKCAMGLSQNTDVTKIDELDLKSAVKCIKNSKNKSEPMKNITSSIKVNDSYKKTNSKTNAICNTVNANSVQFPSTPVQAFKYKEFDLPLKDYGELVQRKLSESMSQDSNLSVLSQSLISGTISSPKNLRNRKSKSSSNNSLITLKLPKARNSKAGNSIKTSQSYDGGVAEKNTQVEENSSVAAQKRYVCV